MTERKKFLEKDLTWSLAFALLILLPLSSIVVEEMGINVPYSVKIGALAFNVFLIVAFVFIRKPQLDRLRAEQGRTCKKCSDTGIINALNTTVICSCAAGRMIKVRGTNF